MPKYTKAGARIVTVQDVRQGFMDLLNRLDATTKYLMDLAAAHDGDTAMVQGLEQEIGANMEILDQFRRKEAKQ